MIVDERERDEMATLCTWISTQIPSVLLLIKRECEPIGEDVANRHTYSMHTAWWDELSWVLHQEASTNPPQPRNSGAWQTRSIRNENDERRSGVSRKCADYASILLAEDCHMTHQPFQQGLFNCGSRNQNSYIWLVDASVFFAFSYCLVHVRDSRRNGSSPLVALSVDRTTVSHWSILRESGSE